MAADRRDTPAERPIRVGDLVQVVRWPCCGFGLGYTFVVTKFIDFGKRRCRQCRAGVVPPATNAVSDADPTDGLHAAVPLEWLKRIPPLSELGDVETKETVDA